MLWGPRTLRVGGPFPPLSHQRFGAHFPADQQCNGPLHSARGCQSHHRLLCGEAHALQLLQPAAGEGVGREGQGRLQPPQQGTPLPTPPYRREETEDLGNQSGLSGPWAGPSSSEASIPSCSICWSRAAHSGVPWGKPGPDQASPASEEPSQRGCTGFRPGGIEAEPSLRGQRLGKAMQGGPGVGGLEGQKQKKADCQPPARLSPPGPVSSASPSPRSGRMGDGQLSWATWGGEEPERPAPRQGPAQDTLLQRLQPPL